MKNINKILGGMVVVLAIISGFIGFDQHYVSSGEMKQLESKVVQTLDTFQMKMSIQFDLFLLDRLRQEERTLRQWVRQYPSDQNAKRDLIETEKQIKSIRKRIEERVN